MNRLERRGWRRGPATGLVFLALAVAIGLFLWAIGSFWSARSRTSPTRRRTTSKTSSWINDTFDANVDADDIGQQIQDSGIAEGAADELVSAG